MNIPSLQSFTISKNCTYVCIDFGPLIERFNRLNFLVHIFLKRL